MLIFADFDPTDYVKTILPLFMLILSCYFLFIGMNVILKKKPFIIPAKIPLVLILLAFLPQLVNTFAILSEDPPGRLYVISFLSMLLYFCLIVFLWLQMKGYLVFGVSDKSFRDALHFSLKKNELPFEERISRVDLPSVGASLQVVVQSWIGFGQFNLKGKVDPSIIKKIISGLNEYYFENDFRPKRATSIFYIVAGFLSLMLSMAFFFFFR